ncbi:MAG: biopolymer transporter ExbD [Phycisphaerae bacterium]|nr:biopolymer transporter ExbD [Phycisphaerae bacterium]
MKHYHSIRQRFASSSRMQIRMIPMIDVVFLLLIFFLMTANFRPREGFLPAELPRQITRSDLVELEPLLIYLQSRPDGSCVVDIGDAGSFTVGSPEERGSFSDLGVELKKIIAQQGRNLDDPVKLVPNALTKWDHVVKTYDMLWQLDLRNIIFTMVE